MKSKSPLLLWVLFTTFLSADNPNLSFSKFSEALKEGRAAANTSLQTFEEPWEDRLQHAPARRQPSQLGATSKQLEMQALKYQKEQRQPALKKEEQSPKIKSVKITPKKIEQKATSSSTSSSKTSFSDQRSLSERLNKLKQKKTTPVKTLPKKEKETSPKSPLKVQVIKDGDTAKPQKTRKVQENNSKPTKIKNFKY
jgi:hypothetical protein